MPGTNGQKAPAGAAYLEVVKDQPMTLIQRRDAARALVRSLADRKRLSELARHTEVPYNWLSHFASGGAPNLSVERLGEVEDALVRYHAA